MATIKLGKKSLEEADKYIRATLLGSATRIIKSTPVDTGRLRANWQSSLNSPKSGVINATGQSASIADARSSLLKIEIGDDFYLVNNLDYAYKIELQRGMIKTEIARLGSIGI